MTLGWRTKKMRYFPHGKKVPMVVRPEHYPQVYTSCAELRPSCVPGGFPLGAAAARDPVPSPIRSGGGRAVLPCARPWAENRWGVSMFLGGSTRSVAFLLVFPLKKQAKGGPPQRARRKTGPFLSCFAGGLRRAEGEPGRPGPLGFARQPLRIKLRGSQGLRWNPKPMGEG